MGNNEFSWSGLALHGSVVCLTHHVKKLKVMRKNATSPDIDEANKKSRADPVGWNPPLSYA